MSVDIENRMRQLFTNEDKIMRKMIMPMVAVLFMASCTEQSLLNEYEYGTTESARVQDTSTPSLIKTYTEMARWGDATAYMNLAKCYHDGIGVKADLMVTSAMLDLAANYGQPDMAQAFVDSLPPDDYLKMAMDAISHIGHIDESITDSIVDALIGIGSPDGYAFRGMIQFNQGDTISAIQNLMAGKEKGSSLADILLCTVPIHDEQEREIVKAERLSSLTDQYPIVNIFLGDMYSEDERNDAGQAHKAAVCYQQADRHGFLNKRQARWLLDYYTREGIQIDDKEKERLEALAVKVWERNMPEIEYIEEPIDSVYNETIPILN